MTGWLRRFAPLLAVLLCAAAGPPAERLAVLQRGINITNWFRFPASHDPAALHGYVGDNALEHLRRIGFTFVRLPVQPELLADASMRDALQAAIVRIERQRLGALVVLHPPAWHLETSEADRAALLASWRVLAPLLGRFDPALTFPELLNEPVFANAADVWRGLQHQVLMQVRRALPPNTIVLTGNTWGGIDGLLAMVPDADSNVVYSVHLYEPAELTSLAAWRSDVDRTLLERLPFPVADVAACEALAESADSATGGVIGFYCRERWDAARVAARIDAAAGWARANGTALLAGEFGATVRLNAPARQAWLAAVRRACEHASIGWALWGYDDIMGFAMPRPPHDRTDLDPGTLRALFPAAILQK